MKEKIIQLSKKSRIIAFLLVNIEYYFRWCKGHRDSNIISAIDEFVSAEKRADKRYMAHIIKDMLYTKYVNDFTHFNEYFMFGFDEKKRSDRSDYVESGEYIGYAGNMKKYAPVNIFNDKILAYKELNGYYGRECIGIESFDDYPKFVDYVQKHKTFMLKDVYGSLGIGIAKIDADGKDTKQLFFEVLQKSPCILEEYIVQSNELAVFNPSSVNTVRFVMFTHPDGSITDVYSMFRTGVGDTVIDNASMGGIACAVDTETGVVISNGFVKKNKDTYTCHPISKIAYKGFQIPRWNELKQVCYDASKLVPGFKLIGWDMALTDNGWVIVEGNSRPHINTIQMCLGHGLRDVIEKTVATL